MAKVALVQRAPVVLNKSKSIEKVVQIINELVEQSVELAVFPETYLPGYPAWIWRLRPGGDWGTSEQVHARLLKNSIDLSTNELDPILSAAAKNNMTIVLGLNERASEGSKSTIYNSAILISNNGKLINVHRKLMPTNPERMVWGNGDASGLNVVDTPVGKVGSLICWENFMPLSRYALYAQGVEVYIAPTYDSGDGSIGTMQHIAREGRCWVLCCGVALERHDLPDDFPSKDELYSAEEDWINPGDSVVVAPGGEIVAGPLNKEKGYLICDIDSDKATYARRALDVAGHYARPDIFNLTINKAKQTHINVSFD